MKVFVTPPIKYLELSELGDGFYCLAQLYKHNKKYRAFTKKMKESGKFIILDSGAGDEGEIIQKEELFELTQEILPNEVIPTDELYNSSITILNLVWFINKMKKTNMEGVGIFACPQARTVSEYKSLLFAMSTFKEVTTIGLSKKTIPYVYGIKVKDQDIDIARITMVYELQKYPLIYKKNYHCLGMGDCREFLMYKGFSNMRSTDSCYPILAAMNDLDLENDPFVRYPTPKDYFELGMTDKQIELAKKNISFLKKCCH
jgi:hypothetical protein